MHRILGFAVSAWLVVGCSATTSSRNIRTAGVVALIDVTSEREGEAMVATELVIGGASSNTYMILEGSDRLTASIGSDTRVMTAVDEGEYEARFALGEGDVTVAFERDGDDDAPSSRGAIGPGFAIKALPEETPVSRDKDVLELSWTPVDPQANVSVELAGDCVIRERRELGGDAGRFRLERGELRAWKKKRADTCAVDVEVTRTRRGTTDPALDSDSRFSLHQVRRARFISAP